MDVEAILNDLRAALKAELSEGYSTVSGFVESQGRLLVEQAKFIAVQRATGDLRDNDALFAFFEEGLKANTRNFAHSVAMLTVLTIEKAWNAVANVLWGSIRTILGAAGVPAELLPETPPHV